MSAGQIEISFGIGTIALDGEAATAVVVNDHVATLREIVARHATPGAVAPPMRDFMPHWERWHDWLRGRDLDPSREEGWRPAASVKFMAPVPEPGNIFHTYHNYDRPSSTTGRRDPPKAERILPDVFLGSRAALSGHRDTVYREHGGAQFDFELEVTAVIGKTASRISAAKAEDYVAGYTIGNDLTMHFGWWRKLREQTRLNDNIRMKNFPGYTPMGPVIVPRDIVGDPHALRVSATVDGVLRLESDTSGMIWRVNELIEYLSWIMPLQPGDLILAGSPEELPLPPGERRGIKVGQTVVLQAERLGRLETRVAEQDFRQPNELSPTE
jgi:2-keto-4-pentenoate hydratase/2-oxohepta-3-ene-1,7-dioic acid hydratase in catechol pathway